MSRAPSDKSSFPYCVPSWIHASLPVPLSYFDPRVSVLWYHGISTAFSFTLWNSLPLNFTCITKISRLIGWPLSQGVKQGLWDCFGCFLLFFEQTLSYDEEAVQILKILELQSIKLGHQIYHCWRLHTLKSVLQKFPNFCSISDAVNIHTVLSHQHGVMGLLHIESVPDGTTHCIDSPICLQHPSHMHPSAPFVSSSHRCLPHCLVVQANWLATLSQIVVCRVPLSASSPQFPCSRKSCAFPV